jgi:hypothetical protein
LLKNGCLVACYSNIFFLNYFFSRNLSKSRRSKIGCSFDPECNIYFSLYFQRGELGVSVKINTEYSQSRPGRAGFVHHDPEKTTVLCRTRRDDALPPQHQRRREIYERAREADIHRRFLQIDQYKATFAVQAARTSKRGNHTQDCPILIIDLKPPYYFFLTWSSGLKNNTTCAIWPHR